MSRWNIRFERDPSLDHIDVVIRAPEEDDTVAELMERLTGGAPDAFPVFDGYGNLKTIKPGDIISASVDGKRVEIITAEGSWLTRRTLQSLEEVLDSRKFVRISRYELINLDKVLRYDFTMAGTLRIELAGGIETWASRRCIPAIRRRLTGKE